MASPLRTPAPLAGAPPLISIASPRRPLDRALLQTRGGFAWWYMDLLDAHRSGAVLIWSYALPFLPGVASAARAGQGVIPAERPSVNLAIYERGRLVDYLLQEIAPERASWEVDGERTVWRFGDSVMRRVWDEARVTLDVALDCPLPGTSKRLQGTIRLDGPARQDHAPGAPHDPHHDWTPMMGPGRGSLDLQVGRVRHHVEGRAYFDRNGGQHALHELGFERWIWGRLPFGDHETIYYVLWPQGGGEPVTVGMTIDLDGRTQLVDDLEVRTLGPRRSLAGGMRWHQHVELWRGEQLWLSTRTREAIDEGPFYLRFFVEGQQRGERVVGIGEVCEPGRVDQDVWRPLVQMRVHHADAPGSMWTPLFTGPRRGRLARLLRHNLPGSEG